MEIRAEALEKLEYFCLNHLSKYSAHRNFDNGPEQRENVSELSKYVSHRILDEVEVLKTSYKKFSYPIIEKFIQEVLWRTYWKGWLEMRPQLWQKYKADLNKLKDEVNKEEYQNAIMAQTKIEPFNDWVKELKEHGYLHNHARMWFASIWIFTLNLPWQLGADFFLKHLLDGDPASNTLSWRWVAGLQTRGKNYLATSWNINKFSKKKYNNLKLNENAAPILESENLTIQPLHFDKVDFSNSLLVIHNLDSVFLQKYKNKFQFNHCALMDFNTVLENNFSKKVLDFKSAINIEILTELKNNFGSNLIIKNKDDLLKIITNRNIKNVIMPYLTCGYENDYISEIKTKINISYLVREYDQFCFPFANKGFFAFKDQIPKILAKFVI